jgi:hypothetical protein
MLALGKVGQPARELLQQLSLKHGSQLQSVGPEMLAALAAILEGRGWTRFGAHERARQTGRAGAT